MKLQSFWATFLVLGVTVIGIWFRYHDITQYPPGLFPDQAANGEDALLILSGDDRPFYPRGNGREALFFYIQAGFIKAFGIGVWPMFAASALVGALTVIATYFATRVWFGKLAGLLSTFFLATSYWHVAISRTGFRAIMIPFFVALFTAFAGYVIQSVKKKKIPASYLYAILAGAAFAGGFYTYIAYRVMIGVVLGIFILLLLAAIHPKIGFPHFRRYGLQFLVGLAAVAVTFLPLGLYFVHHPQDFIGRAGQVSVFSPDLQKEYGGGTLLGVINYSAKQTLLSFFWQGDMNWRHNVSGFPLINPLVGLLFVLGLLWMINGFVQVCISIMKGKEVHMGMIYAYLLLVLIGMLAPVISTAEGMPHALRSVGLIVPTFMLAGTALAVIVRFIQKKIVSEMGRTVLLGVIGGLLILSMMYDGALYFLISGNSAEAYREYRGDLTVVSQYINDFKKQHPDSPRPNLVLDEFSVQTVHFLTSVAAHDYQNHPDEAQHKYTLLRPETSSLINLAPNEFIIFTQSTTPDADRYEQNHPDDVEKVDSIMNRFGEEIMRIYKGKSTAPVKDEFDLDA